MTDKSSSHYSSAWRVIKLGGSIFSPNGGPSGEYLAQFCNLIIADIQRGNSCLLLVGGGWTNRIYNNILPNFPNSSDEDADWIGIATITFHAQVLLQLFNISANVQVRIYPKVCSVPTELPEDLNAYNLIIGGAEKPGHSSNYDAVIFAEALSCKDIVNISDTRYVMTADPRSDSSARAFKTLRWDDYFPLIPENWVPKMSVPFDPVASRRADQSGTRVLFMSGKPLDAVERFLSHGEIEGTLLGDSETSMV